MKDLLAEDYFLLHVPIMVAAALIFGSFFLLIVKVTWLNTLLFSSVVTLTTIGIQYFGPHLSINFAGYIPHLWISGAILVFVFQYRKYGHYWE